MPFRAIRKVFAAHVGCERTGIKIELSLEILFSNNCGGGCMWINCIKII